MSDFVILTDSGCDICAETLASWGVKAVCLSLKFSGEDTQYKADDISCEEFYARMREGASAKTSAINMEEFKDFFREYLTLGKDVLYLAFSSGLSNTYNASRLAADELLEEFPDNRVITIDTLCASAGEGLLVKLAVDKKESGANIVETARYVTATREKLCHWFTVDDLVYLKRGGRVSPTAAFFGGMLNIKPVLHVDDEGKLVPVTKVRGRKAALSAIAQKYEELATDKNGVVYISHGDCIEDARYLETLLKEKYGAKEVIISYVGAVIGSHAGPGTVALFFLGKNR